MDEKQFLDAWEIHNRINLYLLDGIEAEHLSDHSASKGRSVGEQFAHLHNVTDVVESGRAGFIERAEQD